VIFLGRKIAKMATQFSENKKFCRKFPVFEEKNSPKSDRKLVFLGGMVSPHLCLLATVFRVS
jgi:hypothetical protein